MNTPARKIVLKNGVRLVLAPDANRNVVTVMTVFGVGSRFESDKEAGISHVLEHMFFKGSKKRPNHLKIAEFIENIGGENNAFTSKEYTGFYAKVASCHLEKAVDFISDLLLNPLFPADELEREKGVILQELAMYDDLPMEIAATKFEEALFGDNALGRTVIGFKKSISNVTREDLVEYWQKYYGAGSAVIVLAGNLGMTESDAVNIAEKYFQFPEIKSSETPEITLNNNKSKILVGKNTEQSHLVIGFPASSSSDKDRHPLRLLTVILGGSMSSRMFTEIREKRGLAYAVRSVTEHYHETGALATYAGVPHDKILPAIEAVINEYRKIRNDITDDEVARAKEILLGKLLIEFEDTNEVASHYALSELLLGEILSPEELQEIYKSLTKNDILKVAKKYINDERMALSFVGPKLDEIELNKIFTL